MATSCMSWNPEKRYSDKERWICIYPAYVNSKKTIAEGRIIPKSKAVDNPTYTEIRDVLQASGCAVEVENKVYPREQDARDNRFRGRIRVHLKNDDGTALNSKFPTKKSVLFYLGETIPKLKTRQQGQSSGQQGSAQQQGGAGSAGGKQKKKGKKNR